MKTQSLGWLVGLGAAACSFASCAEPATECQVGLAGYNSYVVVYTAKGSPSPAGCDMATPTVVQMGDLIGMEYYHPATADGTTYDDTQTTVTIQSNSMGQEVIEYYSGCPAPSCFTALTCGQDSDCTPDATGMGTTVMGSCDATNGVCLTATCVSSADCNGAPCNNGSCGVSCGPVAGCTGTCATDSDCSNGDTCAAGVCATSCASCPTGQTCGAGGFPGFCGTGAACVPLTCATAMANCGATPDGCGGTVSCGTCTAPQTCGGNGTANVCGAPVPDPNAADTLYAMGSFAQHFPDTNDMCQLTGLTPAAQTFAALPATARPTDTVGYSWSNVNVYVTAAAQGTQFSADMTYTENGCSASYQAVGVWPAVSCTDTVPDPTDPRGLNVIGQVANPDLCNPCAEPAKGRFVGSGIIPDFPVTCQQIFPTACTGGNCMTADAYGRDPWYCVIDGSKGIPQLDPNPPTCQ